MIARCVVADDHPALVAVVSDVLRAAGLDVVGTAADGLHVLELVRDDPPDVAVVDFRMPRLCGVELLERLQAAAPDVAVLVYTADLDEAVVRTILSAGAAGVVLKSSPIPDLVRAVSTVLDGGTYLDPSLASFAFAPAPAAPALTDREAAVLSLLATGLSHDEIGARLSITGETVRTHVRKASSRLGATTRTQAVATALRHGLIS